MEPTKHDKGFFAWCRRYINLSFIAIMSVLVYIMFFTDNSVAMSYEQDREIERLKAEIKSNTDTLRHYEALNKGLNSDPEIMERVARENFHMQRPGEDIYVE